MLLRTDPPTTGDVYLFCHLVPRFFTIFCDYSTTRIKFTPDVVVNGAKSPITDLDEEVYTWNFTEFGGFILQFALSSDFNGYNFSCKLNETVQSRKIQLLAGTHKWQYLGDPRGVLGFNLVEGKLLPQRLSFPHPPIFANCDLK